MAFSVRRGHTVPNRQKRLAICQRLEDRQRDILVIQQITKPSFFTCKRLW